MCLMRAAPMKALPCQYKGHPHLASPYYNTCRHELSYPCFQLQGAEAWGLEKERKINVKIMRCDVLCKRASFSLV